MKKERIIRVHFTGRSTLELRGAHVPTFFENYEKGVIQNNLYFFSYGEDKIAINMSNVTFIEETEAEEKKDVPF